MYQQRMTFKYASSILEKGCLSFQLWNYGRWIVQCIRSTLHYLKGDMTSDFCKGCIGEQYYSGFRTCSSFRSLNLLLGIFVGIPKMSMIEYGKQKVTATGYLSMSRQPLVSATTTMHTKFQKKFSGLVKRQLMSTLP